MASFDIVSKLDMGEMKNVVNMAQKQITGRYDFKGSNITMELKETTIELKAEDEYKMGAALDILRGVMAKRGIGMKAVEPGEIQPTGNQMLKQTLSLQNGVDKDQGKAINKIIKNSGMKLTSSYLDEKVRVTGKKIDDLQTIFSLVKNHEDVKVDLKMENMKG
jgi:uncharacterized protein YajQ (UPF0234 family)